MSVAGSSAQAPLMEFELVEHSDRQMGRSRRRARTRTRSPRHDPVPDVAMRAPDGTPHRLTEFKGQNVVLHVFDQDRKTAAREARALQRHLAEFQALNAQVVGVAPAGPRAQGRFAKKNHIGFMLLSDKERQMIGRLGATGNMTVIIDEDGRVDKVYRAGRHAERDATRILGHLGAIGRNGQWSAEGRPPA